MPQRRRKTQKIPMTIGNDPTLWRFDSLPDALAAHTNGLAQLIRDGERLAEQESQENELKHSA